MNVKYFLGIICILFSVKAFSWDGHVSGKIYNIDVTGGENYGFRLSLDGGTKSLCGNNHKWAYLNESASNYQTYVAVLLAAKMADKTVILYTNQKGGNGYCEIGYVSVR